MNDIGPIFPHSRAKINPSLLIFRGQSSPPIKEWPACNRFNDLQSSPLDFTVLLRKRNRDPRFETRWKDCQLTYPSYPRSLGVITIYWLEFPFFLFLPRCMDRIKNRLIKSIISLLFLVCLYTYYIRKTSWQIFINTKVQFKFAPSIIQICTEIFRFDIQFL